jgi:leucyl aminopeptidase
MSEFVKVHFVSFDDALTFKAKTKKETHTLVIFAGPDLALGSATLSVVPAAVALIKSAGAAAKFTGKANTAMEILSPAGFEIGRLLVVGIGAANADFDAVTLGGFVSGKLGAGRDATILIDLPNHETSADNAADITLGLQLRAYKFDQYKTKKPDADEKDTIASITLAVSDVSAAKAANQSREAVAEGVIIARDLVNEPPNVLYPEEFANRAAELKKLGVSIDILDMKDIEKLGMRALLGVGQGSARESRVVIMRWNGAKNSKDKPVAFVGKGVTFDSGGISIKPAAGMEDMKGDMGGAACVVGLMHVLASRKAKANVIGAIGLVENMPDGNAQRPGDIVKSMSGQTIEIINTDAEGRLVLADVLWHVQDKYKPAFIVDLATLTGAILVALGQEYAGLFSNNDELAERLFHSGKATGERVWRLPLGKAFDKMIDSKFADMKNTGGRHAGSITAAQFLQRYVNDTPWAHLDIAGMGMAAATSEINQSWGPGWGVRLLNRLVADHYES